MFYRIIKTTHNLNPSRYMVQIYGAIWCCLRHITNKKLLNFMRHYQREKLLSGCGKQLEPQLLWAVHPVSKETGHQFWDIPSDWTVSQSSALTLTLRPTSGPPSPFPSAQSGLFAALPRLLSWGAEGEILPNLQTGWKENIRVWYIIPRQFLSTRQNFRCFF